MAFVYEHVIVVSVVRPVRNVLQRVDHASPRKIMSHATERKGILRMRGRQAGEQPRNVQVSHRTGTADSGMGKKRPP